MHLLSPVHGTPLRLHDKSCRLQHPHDLLRHAILLNGKDGDLYYGLDRHSKQIYKLTDARCLLKHRSENHL